ncbi:unnamed protein product [Rodentolepis nana]|uniref:Prominin-1-A-like n=1 Tax=Rodentolepis nana TaxID=102285 RepID=A0A0R3T5L5_RODNA|nr:unnamed protein product [Rodentolepis nana]
MLLSLEARLLSTAIVIFNWATSTFNCGIFNYIFTVTANNTIKVTQSSISNAILEAVNQNLFQGGSRRLEVYNWLPVELQTGSGVSRNVAILTGVTIIVSLLFLILPLSVITVTCCCHCRFRAKENANINRSHGKDTYQGAYFLEKIHAQALEAIKNSDKSTDCFNLCHIIVFVVTFLLLVALTASVGVLFIAGFMVTDMLTEDTAQTPPTSFSSDNFTILTGVKFIFSQFLDFLNTGISDGIISTEILLKDINSTFMNVLEPKVSSAVDELLVTYGVKPLMHAGETLQGDLKVLETNMDYIRLHNQQVSQDISQLVGKFSTIYNLVGPELDKVCNRSMGPEIEILCDSLKRRAPILILQFNASAIKVDPPAVLNFIFNELGVDLTEILKQFSEFTVKIEEVENDVLAKLSSFLDLNSMLAPLMRVWDTLGNATVSISGNLTKITESISANTSSSRALVSVLIYAPLTLILAHLVANSVVATLYALEAKKTEVFYRSSTDSYDSSRVCSNSGNLVHATIILVFFTILCILIILLLPAVTMFASDGCVYLVEQKGVAQTDCILNSYIENEIWPTIVAEIEGALEPSVRDFLVLSSPRNIVNASTVICGESIHTTNFNGLLRAVGWNTFISIPKVFASADVQKKIQEGELTLKQEILNQNLGSLIPSDLDEIIKTTQNLTHYFDAMNYQPSIDELSPSKLPSKELANYASDLETLISKIQNLGLQASDILQRCVILIRDDMVALEQVGRNASKLREAFMEVQARRNLTTGINSLVAGIEEVRKTFSNDSTILAPITPIYWNLVDSFKVDLESGLDPVIQSFLHSILPCSKVYAAADALLQLVCKQNGVLSRAFVWLYILAITASIAVVLFFSTFLLGFIQTHHFRRLKCASQIFLPSKTSSCDRYIPYPSSSCRNQVLGSHSLKKQVHSSNELKRQQELPNYRLTAPIPAAYVDRRDCNPLRAFPPADEIMAQDGASEMSANSFYEDPTYHPVPAPRSGRQNRMAETELHLEALNSHPEEKLPTQKHNED